jgi:hypothetical protein
LELQGGAIDDYECAAALVEVDGLDRVGDFEIAGVGREAIIATWE